MFIVQSGVLSTNSKGNFRFPYRLKSRAILNADPNDPRGICGALTEGNAMEFFSQTENLNEFAKLASKYIATITVAGNNLTIVLGRTHLTREASWRRIRSIMMNVFCLRVVDEDLL